MACLFNTIAASVELEHNFFDDEHQGLQKCGGQVVDRAKLLAKGAAGKLAANKANNVKKGLLKKFSDKLKAKRILGLLPTNGEKFLKKIDLLLDANDIVILFTIKNINNNSVIQLTLCSSNPNSCTKNPLILNLQ